MTCLHYEIEWYCIHCPATGRQESSGYDWDPAAILDGAIESHAIASPDCHEQYGHAGLAMKAPKVKSGNERPAGI